MNSNKIIFILLFSFLCFFDYFNKNLNVPSVVATLPGGSSLIFLREVTLLETLIVTFNAFLKVIDDFSSNAIVLILYSLSILCVALAPSCYCKLQASKVRKDELFDREQDVSPPDPKNLLNSGTFADAVGYEAMEIRKPREASCCLYDVYLADLFFIPESPDDIHIDIVKVSKKKNKRSGKKYRNKLNELKMNADANNLIQQANDKKQSYADAVGYDTMGISLKMEV